MPIDEHLIQYVMTFGGIGRDEAIEWIKENPPRYKETGR